MALRGVLLDVDGVLVVSWKPIDGAVDALRRIRATGVPIVFLTNTTSRTRDEIEHELEAAGLSAAGDELVTAGSATASFLTSHFSGKRCLMLNEGPLDDFSDLVMVDPGDPADVVVIGSAGPSFSWELMNHAARAVLAGAELVAMHGSTTWQTDDGICIDGGAYVAALEQATGCETTTIGKPAAPMFTEALEHLGVPAADAVMVGDDLRSDVLAAQAVGIRGVLVRTGKFRPEVLEAAGDQPDAVIDSIADFPEWLDAR